MDFLKLYSKRPDGRKVNLDSGLEDFDKHISDMLTFHGSSHEVPK
jgi:hypothetical protein